MTKRSSQSIRASRQPRDRNGRWISQGGGRHGGNHRSLKDKIAVIDEAGDMGLEGKGRHSGFLIAATLTDRYEDLAAIAERYPKNTRPDIMIPSKGLKYSTSSDEIRRAVLEDIAELEPSINVVVVRKEELPPDTKLKGRRMYRSTMKDLIEEVADGTEGDLTVLYDRHSALTDEFMIKAVKDVIDVKPTINLKEVRKGSIEDKEIQVQDFVAGSSSDKLNEGRESPFDIIRAFTKVREKKG